MRVYKWSGCKHIPRSKKRGILQLKGKMTLCGFYILKDDFFSKMNDPYLKNNKDGNRPFYYCVKENSELKNVYWMIPLSSRVDKYKRIMASKLNSHKPCDGLYVCKLPSGVESAFLIQDIFPVTDSYIEREFTLGSNHLVLPYQNDIDAIELKAKRVIRLIKNGVKITPTSPNIMKILEVLNAERN